ncbi:MAG TPA: 4Fe-4S dicluster domain-containing protein [Nitrospinota bacterium]|nr:4Fe-4S dicluster domain-containing protein [Nitrospinota bacterium]|tara:strand:+ start:239629 stop:240813 length:1185 start_codon:yes stop_codon:yes gene_type:complete
MGHISGSKSELVPLIDRLNKYPIGLVDNDKLREILSIIFDEKEAYVASKFPLEEATLDEISVSSNISVDELLPILECMADKGLVLDMPYEGVTYYLLMPGLIGFFEFTFMKNRADLPMEELATLMTDYLNDTSGHGQADEFFGSKTQLTRALVYDDNIPVTSTITEHESAREIVKKAGYGAAGLCYCRHKKHHQGKKCKKDVSMEDICITLGKSSDFLVRRGFHERKTVDELLAILDYAKSKNLTHVTENVRNQPAFICNCCSCCCELMHGVQAGYTNGLAKTAYYPHVDSCLCDYCGKCIAACNVKALGSAKRISNGKRHTYVNSEACLGCGVCIDQCDRNALTMNPRKPAALPVDRNSMFKSILWEKGKLLPFIADRIKNNTRSILSKLTKW